jgi:glycosyltransferase involved in cell wall biosynthesis
VATKILSANAPYNGGGIGRYLAVLVEEARRRGELHRYFATAVRPNDTLGYEIALRRFRPLFHAPPLRWRSGWRDYLGAELFDRAVARRLDAVDAVHGFSGRVLHSFRRARKLGAKELILESATSHIDNVLRQHRLAARAYPIEESWLNTAQYKKTLREYRLADTIYVSSEYSRQSFLAAGVPATRLRSRVMTVSSRFTPPPEPIHANGFHIVYVGRLQVSKGVPVLLDAFARLDDPAARLTLVGGTATDQMDRYLRRRLTTDRRISIEPGDPLPQLHRADVFVHPSFEDGLGLAPLEALACGVPVLVTEQTGMKEFVVPGENGFVTAAGDVYQLLARLEAVRAKPLKGCFKPLQLVEAAK